VLFSSLLEFSVSIMAMYKGLPHKHVLMSVMIKVAILIAM
jgi:hypothetical protein